VHPLAHQETIACQPNGPPKMEREREHKRDVHDDNQIRDVGQN